MAFSRPNRSKLAINTRTVQVITVNSPRGAMINSTQVMLALPRATLYLTEPGTVVRLQNQSFIPGLIAR